jgi:hypothetical protein
VSRASCEAAAWDVAVTACEQVPCGNESCAPGQVCRERASGAYLVECVDNPCGTSALTCECASSLCYDGDTCSTSDLSVYCNSNCEGCP